MLPWSASASPKNARNRRWCSALPVSTRARQQRALLGRERLEAFRSRGLHHLARHVHSEQPDPVLAREQEDVPVVVPVIAPAPVPVRSGQERLLVEPLVRAPAVQPLLLGRGRRIHLQAHEHLAPSLVELLDHAQLHAVELGVRVALAHEHEPHAVEPCRELRGCHDVAARRVGDAVDHERGLPAAASRVADVEVERAVVGARETGRAESHDERGEPQSLRGGAHDRWQA